MVVFIPHISGVGETLLGGFIFMIGLTPLDSTWASLVWLNLLELPEQLGICSTLFLTFQQATLDVTSHRVDDRI